MNQSTNQNMDQSTAESKNTGTNRDLAACREHFRLDRFATEVAGATIEAVGDGYARCQMILEDRHRNARGAVMGGAVFTLADFAFAVASNVPGVDQVSLTSQATFLSASRGTLLIAEARRVKEGRSTSYYTVTVTDDCGKNIAAVTVTGMKV